MCEIIILEQKKLDEYDAKITVLRKKIKDVHQRVFEKFKEDGRADSVLPVCHGSFQKRLDSTVRHLTDEMVERQEFLEEIKQRRSIEKDEVEIYLNEANLSANQHNTSGTETSINSAIEDWMNSRLGALTLTDSSHVVLDTSGYKTEKSSEEFPVRIRGHIKQPLDNKSSFRFDGLHPLRGSIEDMNIAKIAVKSMTPCVLANHVIWKQIEDVDHRRL
ncbi:hypothetical protein Aperf_G00000004803 [Anoplocephala perfoliata]